jgi:hypothetical protein
MIEPSLEHLLEHFINTEFMFLADEFTSHPSTQVPLVLGQDRKSLKELGLAYIRVSGTGKEIEAGPLAEVHAFLVFNALKGSGGTLPGFAGLVLDSARSLGVTFVLHRLGGGPVKLIDTSTGITKKVYRDLPEALDPFFSLLRGTLFHVEVLGRALNRVQSSRSMIGMAAQCTGEMMSPEDFVPARFSDELEELIGLLRAQRMEFGFVCARLVAEKPKIEALQEGAEALGMVAQEVYLVQNCPGTPKHGLPIGQPFLLVTMEDPRCELMDHLNELAVQHRQDHFLRVYRDGAIELVSPYHNTVKETFVDLHAALRAYVDDMIPNGPIPMVEVRMASEIDSARTYVRNK